MRNGEGARDSSRIRVLRMYQPGLSDVGQRIRVGLRLPGPWCLAWYPAHQSQLSVPELCVGLGGWGLKACLAAGAHYQTTGKCQRLPGHLSLSAWLPAAFCLPQKACRRLQWGPGPGQEGQAEGCLAFVYSHLIFGSCASDELPGV